ncbi:G-protein coupled receptor 126-like [Labeo rohita]|uniref:G-protein coupled receptor 126-like n=1 Tax=Labeo rohita TaxID=84645 RepID=A0A498ME97_LABRO|nr:G-protein coupled receptor 126-like [Labeo rohita]
MKRYTYSCQYYDKQGNNTWKTDGCNTTQISDGVVECSCDHMTPFAVLLQLTRPFYGYKNVTLSNSNATNLVCWITEPLILYGVNLCYFTIVFLFNTIVLITVSRQIFKLKKVDNKHKKIPVKDASTVLGFMCLLGTSWGLVFLGSGYTSYPILYVFCISNTMQGETM